jgi:hypothetical protein
VELDPLLQLEFRLGARHGRQSQPDDGLLLVTLAHHSAV